VEPVVPIVETIAAGRSPPARSSATAAARDGTSIRNSSSTGMRRSPCLPMPSVMHAFSIDECASADA
jgi:hypothetical protein